MKLYELTADKMRVIAFLCRENCSQDPWSWLQHRCTEGRATY